MNNVPSVALRPQFGVEDFRGGQRRCASEQPEPSRWLRSLVGSPLDGNSVYISSGYCLQVSPSLGHQPERWRIV